MTGRSDIRPAVLREAVGIGATEGLEHLTIGRMATRLGASKSGVFGLFGSKEQMQLAAIEAAKATFVADVVQPALDTAPGVGRLWALCESWLDNTSRDPQSGGCFFLAVATEFAGRHGPVRDAIAAAWQQWHDFHHRTIIEAQQLGQFRTDADPAQLTFELVALGRCASSDLALFGDPAATERARIAMRDLLRRHVIDPAAHPDLHPRRPEPTVGADRVAARASRVGTDADRANADR